MSDRITLLSSYNEPDTVEMMDDDDSSSDSDDELKSQSNTNDDNKLNNKNRPSNDDDDDDDEDEDEDDEDDDDLKLTTNNNNNNNLTNSNVNTNLMSTNLIPMHTDYNSSEFALHNMDTNQEDLVEEDEERKRFQIELEFVQALANPNYLNFLAQRGYFRNQTFLNYLKYLMYWKEPDYVKYIKYPQCLSLLELLQHEQFLKEIVNAQCSKFIDEQLLLIWSTYKKKRDWRRIDPTRMPDGVEKLFSKQQQQEQKASQDAASDTFSAAAFLANEKF